MDVTDRIYDLVRLRSKRRKLTKLSLYGIPIIAVVTIIDAVADPRLAILNLSVGILLFIFWALLLWTFSYTSSQKYKQSFAATVEKRKVEALACQDPDELLERLHNLTAWCVAGDRFDLAEEISTLALKNAAELPNLPHDNKSIDNHTTSQQ